MQNIKKTSLILLLIVLTALCVTHGKFILIPLLFGGLIAILLDPLVELLGKVINSHIIKYLLSLFISAVIILLPLYFISTSVSAIFASNKSDADLKETYGEITEMVKSSEFFNAISEEQLNNFLAKAINYVQELIGFFVLDSVSAISNIILAFLFSYFLHANYMRTKPMILESLKSDNRKVFDKIINDLPKGIQAYIYSLFKVMLIVGAMSTILFLIINLDHAFLWGSIVGLLVIIPYLGSLIGISIPLIYSLINNGSVDQALYIILGYAVIQFVEGNFVTPRIVGDQIGINPFIIIISMLIMGTVWGISGVIIAIPLLSAIKTILEASGQETFINIFITQKNQTEASQ